MQARRAPCSLQVSDEDVIFVSEKSVPKSRKVTIDQVKLLALQRDIDQESLPKQPTKTLESQCSVAVEKVKMMIKEEKNEENFPKKEKKHTKKQASLPKIKNCTIDDGRLSEVKNKKKKNKYVEAVVIKESMDECSPKEEKKKKKRKIVVESLNDACGYDVIDEQDKVSTKKKKMKKKQLVEEEDKKQRKEKKVKHKSVQVKPENIKVELDEEDMGKTGNNKVQKKAKKGKTSILYVNKKETEKQVKEKMKKKESAALTEIGVTKKKDEVPGNEWKVEKTENKTDDGDKGKAKKKKKEKYKDRSKVKTPEVQGLNKISTTSTVKKMKDDKMLTKKEDKFTKTGIVEVRDGKKALKKKGKKEKERKASVEVTLVEETEPKKRKRKKGQREEENERKASAEVTLVEETEPKKRKRKKGQREEEKERKVSAEVTLVEMEPKKRKRKKGQGEEDEPLSNKVKDEQSRERKKSSTQVERVKNSVRGEKKIKMEKSEDSPQVDVVFLSEKIGSTDEVTINQERRQSLQMEIDKASQPEKQDKPMRFGQWSTAQFSSHVQQQKFLQLMGGFKKGFQPAAASSGGPNMAMGKDAQQQLQQGLLGEFERAHSRSMDFRNRGAGLGFTALSNKKFFIDINACRSVRFDD